MTSDTLRIYCAEGLRAPRVANGREEFDWARMRREEYDYFACAQRPPKAFSNTLEQIKGAIKVRTDNAEIARLKALPYREYLQSEHWMQFRAKILSRDHGCRKCGSHKQLEVHHLTYDRLGEEQNTDVISLCHRCHKAMHRRTIAVSGVPS